MNSDPSPAAPCFSYIVALKYIMAGDMESVDLLRQLEERYRAIDWKDSQFLALTESMRAAPPESNNAEVDSTERLKGLLHHMVEQSVDEGESIRLMIPKVEALSNKYSAALTFSLELARIVGAMKAQLEMLGADTSPYHVQMPPELLEPPPTDVRG